MDVRERLRFNGSNFLKERLILSFTEMWKFQSTKDNGNTLTLEIIVSLILFIRYDISFGVGYCLLLGTGILPQPQ